MSIASIVRTAGPFAGTGSLVALPFAFKVFAASDLVVQRTSTSGAVTTLTLTTHYSVSLNADQDTSPGGTVTLVTALASGETAMVTSNVAATQPLQLASGGPFLPGQIEDALDRAMIVVQQQGVLGDQTLRLPLGEVAAVLPGAEQRANKALLFDEDGAPFLGAPASGSAADVMLQYASTDDGEGASLVGVADAGGYFAGTHVEGALQEIGQDMRGRLRDIRTFPGIAADNVANDLTAFQAACVTARATGCGIYFPAGVKVFLEFSSTTPHLFIDGAVSLVAADPFTSGLRLNCNYEMPAGHAPLICWGIPSKGAVVNKVKGRVSIGWWLTAGCQRFERANHIYGAQDFTVEGNWIDFTQVTWPAADAGHPSGYQAGGWFSSNVQPSFAAGQTQDRNIKFLRNTGFASAEYQNAESIGITRCTGLRIESNYLRGWADDVAAHECVDVVFERNHLEAVSGRIYFDNCQHVKILGNYITAIAKPSGGYLGTTRYYIMGNMITQYAAVTWDAPNYDVLVHGNTVVIPAGGYCTNAVHMFGVSDGLTITDNHFCMAGAPAATAGAIGVSTMFRTGWTGPVGNQDYASGGAVKTRGCTIRGNKCIGSGWGATDGNIGVTVWAGGAIADVVGPVDIDGNVAGGYYIPYESVRFGRNFSTPAATDPFLNLSVLALWDKEPAAWSGVIAAISNSTNPYNSGTPASSSFYTVLDRDSLKFIPQRRGRVIGAHCQLAAAMTAGDNLVIDIVKNVTSVGVYQASTTNTPTTNPARYLWNFAGIAGLDFVDGDLITVRVTVKSAQGATTLTGALHLVVAYA